MLGQIRKGESLIVAKLDRLGRDALDVLQTVRQLAERGIKVIVLNLGSTDLTSPAGKLLLAMLPAPAIPWQKRKESAPTRDRRSAGQQRRRTGLGVSRSLRRGGHNVPSPDWSW